MNCVPAGQAMVTSQGSSSGSRAARRSNGRTGRTGRTGRRQLGRQWGRCREDFVPVGEECGTGHADQVDQRDRHVGRWQLRILFRLVVKIVLGQPLPRRITIGIGRIRQLHSSDIRQWFCLFNRHFQAGDYGNAANTLGNAEASARGFGTIDVNSPLCRSPIGLFPSDCQRRHPSGRHRRSEAGRPRSPRAGRASAVLS